MAAAELTTSERTVTPLPDLLSTVQGVAVAYPRLCQAGEGHAAPLDIGRLRQRICMSLAAALGLREQRGLATHVCNNCARGHHQLSCLRDHLVLLRAFNKHGGRRRRHAPRAAAAVLRRPPAMPPPVPVVLLVPAAAPAVCFVCISRKNLRQLSCLLAVGQKPLPGNHHIWTMA